MAELKTIFVNQIAGKFFIPNYQRGYRWTEREVKRLLDDIYNLVGTDKKYCLQPVVVKKLDDKNFEVIDGQQRLTTLFLIYNYMHKGSGGFIESPKFSLNYETREKSADFLENINFNLQDENIDFYFMANAYRTIENWFLAGGEKSVVMPDMKNLLAKNIQVIWYEVDDTEDSAALFTRLNIGQIPLTNAELVKAMFLSRSNKNIDENKQQEIALQWDNLEKELHNDSLWYFLTNDAPEKYQTRIDLILNLIAGKNSNDEYATFFYFNDLRDEKNLDEVWLEIRKTFLLLKDWHEDHELYHKIGYLIASGDKNISDVYKESKGKTTTEFKRRLDEMICDSVKLAENESYSDWNYNENKGKIRRLLLLFNVESVRQNSESAYWFPFDKFKFVDDKKAAWSLEHIHALKTDDRKGIQENWREWLKLHKESLESLETADTNLIAEIEKLLNRKEFRYEEFSKLQDKILEKFSPNETNDDYANSIANLALIKCAENSALSNSTFDVKRNSIIEMDMHGEFIPFCTKMAFLKYYTKSEKNQIHFWSQIDRAAYLEAINETLAKYLTQPI